MAFDCGLDDVAGDKDSVFERIYRENFWGSGESGSGPGSELDRTKDYRGALEDFLRRERVQSFFDAPCGDLNWMPAVLAAYPMQYSGGDISESAVAIARKRHPELDVRQFDICRDSFPDVDVWHCRDALFHLSFDDIWAALGNASRANLRFVLLTTHRSRMLTNVDVRTGGHRYLDLERAPFNFPPAKEYLEDYLPGQFPRAVGIWPLDAVRRVLEAQGKS